MKGGSDFTASKSRSRTPSIRLSLKARWKFGTLARVLSHYEELAKGSVKPVIGTLDHRLSKGAFAFGAAFAGLGGAIFASRNQYTGPEDHVLMVSINVLCLVIVGGMGSIPGIVAGAFVLKGLPEVLRPLQDYRLVAFGALLVAMMIVRPQGIWPSSRRRLELAAGRQPTAGEPEATGRLQP